MSIKDKTISGLKWSFTDNMVNQGVHFIFGIILARLLSPTEFGIIGMTMVFVAISETFMRGGLDTAVIRKQNATEVDFSTLFYTNICFGIVLFAVLYTSAGAISRFYGLVDLVILVRVMALNIVINSFGLVESAILVKQIDFKRLTRISVISSIVSGITGITLAYLGFGYWSLAAKTLCQNLIRVIMLHWTSSWHPKFMYSFVSFKELFNFGSKMMATSLINTIYLNVYKLVIGKYFASAELGYYSKAEQFKNLPSESFQRSIQRVTFPVLSSMIGDRNKLRSGYKRLIKLLFFIISIFMLLMIINAREIILILLGNKWEPAIPYLQVMCISGMFYPLNSLNLNVLVAMGRSDLYLKVEVLKKIMIIPVIFIGIKFGIIVMLWGIALSTFLEFVLNSSFSAKLIEYPTYKQLLDISPTIIHVIVMSVLAFTAGSIISSNLFLSLLVKLAIVLLYLISINYVFGIPELRELWQLVKEQIKSYLSPFWKSIVFGRS
nr:teichuronic acid exporter [Candidatus Cloacimonadota bacterium]